MSAESQAWDYMREIKELEDKLAVANAVVEAAALVIAMALINHGECDKAGCLFCETYQKYDKTPRR